MSKVLKWMCVIDTDTAMLKALMPEPHNSDKACPGKAQREGRAFLGTGRGKESKCKEETKCTKPSNRSSLRLLEVHSLR